MLPWLFIAAGTVLAFARAMGELAARCFSRATLCGITQTIPIAIYFEGMGGDTDAALFWGAFGDRQLVILYQPVYGAFAGLSQPWGYIKGQAKSATLYTWA